MTFRRKRLSTNKLAALVAPTPLKEALQELLLRGDIEWYELGKYRTTIKLARNVELNTILKEASVPVVNPRPYVANRKNE